jgi:hypothetical protein
VLDPGKRKTQTGYFWALARDDQSWGGAAPPGVAFTYAPGRSGQYADDILKGFSGILQVPSHCLQANNCRVIDGYAGYNRLLKRVDDRVALAYCWAHARRKLYDVAQSGTAPIAEDGLKQIAALYQIERGCGQKLGLFSRHKAEAFTIFNWASATKGHPDMCCVLPADAGVNLVNKLGRGEGPPITRIEELGLQASEEAFTCGIVLRARLS